MTVDPLHIGLLVCLGLIAGGVWSITSARASKRRCTVPTVAWICDVKVNRVQGDHHTDHDFTPVLAYYDLHGQVVTSRGRTYSGNSRQYTVGDTMQIWFNPSRPAEHFTGEFSRASTLLGLVLMVLGVVVAVATLSAR